MLSLLIIRFSSGLCARMSDVFPSSSAASGLASLVSRYRQLAAQSVPLVLATVVEALGSTYRKAGARMLISRDGRFHGLIGGGCFEGDLYEQTQAVFASGEPRLLFYDMRAPGDALWGLGLGCNGAVRILLQRLDDAGRDTTIEQLADTLQRDVATVCITPCDGPDAGRSLLAGAADTLESIAADAVVAEARAVAALGQPALVRHGDVTVFYDCIQPRPRLLLIGAGADATPIVNLATQLDWRVLLVDQRPAYADATRFPAAEAVIHAHPEALPASVNGKRVDAVVLMTHNIDYDARYLQQLVKLPCRYLGLLGPRARRDQLFAQAGLNPTVFGERLHTPVGLDIGGQSPESIALSLVSEIHAVLHERDARPLRDQRQPIQTRAAAN